LLGGGHDSYKTDVVDRLSVISRWVIERTGIFSSCPNKNAVFMSAYNLSVERQAELEDIKAEMIKSVFSLGRGYDAKFNEYSVNTLASSASMESIQSAKDSARLVGHSPSVEVSAFSEAFNAAPLPMPPVGADNAKKPLDIAVRQIGVYRVNCIDSLDRTNVAQFVAGKCALEYQLYALGIIENPTAVEIGNSEIVNLLLDMYEYVGDCLALQYGGSEMHRAMKVKGDVKMDSAPVLLTGRKRTSVGKEMIVRFLLLAGCGFVSFGLCRFLCFDTSKTLSRIR